MWTTREVAKCCPPETNTTDTNQILTIEIVKELNQESLDGITEWSHCWLITIDNGRLGMHAFAIQQRQGRKLTLFPIDQIPSPSSATIIDIKPIHACDISTS